MLPQGTSVLSPSIPLTLVVLPALMIAQKSPQNLFTEHASVYIMAFGMVAAKVTNKLVVSASTFSYYYYTNVALITMYSHADRSHDQGGDGVSGLVAARPLAAVPQPVLQLHRAGDLAAVVHAHLGHPGSAALLRPGVPRDLPAPAHRSLPDTVHAQRRDPASGHRIGEQPEQLWQQCGQERWQRASKVEEQTALGSGCALH